MSNPTAVQTWQCRQCGKQCERPRKPGPVPKDCSLWCKDERVRGKARVCVTCSTEYLGRGKTFCSPQCQAEGKTKNFLLAKAIRLEDWPAVLVEVEKLALPDDNGCWLWPGSQSRGYSRQRVSGKFVSLYRVIAQAKNGGAPLGSQPVHHTCAVRQCVNPEHIVLVTHTENIVEMLARNSYLRRINELETALREVAPEHPALSVAPYL